MQWLKTKKIKRKKENTKMITRVEKRRRERESKKRKMTVGALSSMVIGTMALAGTIGTTANATNKKISAATTTETVTG